jgi:hypothetical protein
MTDDVNQSAVPEITTPTETATNPAPEVNAREAEQERNWRAMRESQEHTRQENERLRIRNEVLEQEFQKRYQSAPQQVEEELPQLAPDDWITADQHKKLTQSQVKGIVAEALAADRKQRAIDEFPNRVRAKFPDFEAVVSDENVNKLKALEPEIAQALGQISDPYAQAVAAYKYIKSLVPATDPKVEAAKARIAENATKPGTATTNNSTSPLAHAGAFERGLSATDRSNLYKEMLQAAKG